MSLKKINNFILKEADPIFRYNGLNNFEDFWNIKAEWFEAPNIRRGGWSGVANLRLKMPGGKNDFGIFLKRQENHITHTLGHPIKGILTFEREARNLRFLQKRGIPSLKLLFFAEQKSKKSRRAILITQELKGYISLKKLLQNCHNEEKTRTPGYNLMMHSVADVVKKMHENHLQHNSLYAKHIFIHQSLLENNFKKTEIHENPVKLIDLEKGKIRLFKSQCIRRDLYTLNRHTEYVSLKDRLRFFKFYTGCKKICNQTKILELIAGYKGIPKKYKLIASNKKTNSRKFPGYLIKKRLLPIFQKL